MLRRCGTQAVQGSDVRPSNTYCPPQGRPAKTSSSGLARSLPHPCHCRVQNIAARPSYVPPDIETVGSSNTVERCRCRTYGVKTRLRAMRSSALFQSSPRTTDFITATARWRSHIAQGMAPRTRPRLQPAGACARPTDWREAFRSPGQPVTLIPTQVRTAASLNVAHRVWQLTLCDHMTLQSRTNTVRRRDPYDAHTEYLDRTHPGE